LLELYNSINSIIKCYITIVCLYNTCPMSEKTTVHPVVSFQYLFKANYSHSIIEAYHKFCEKYLQHWIDNITFDVKNYLISSFIPFIYWHSSKYTCSAQFFSSNIKNTVDVYKHFMYI